VAGVVTEVLRTVADLDAASAVQAAGWLRPSCGSETWLATVVAGRPYRELSLLLATAAQAVAALSWGDIEQALAAHPRIGQRAAGADVESAWSRQEQAATATAPSDVSEQLRVGNLSYERHFGHVFLICATGRTSEQMLAALHSRLENDAATEREVVRGELAQIVALRLAKTFR
jgi:2-oxo-4-hydroxy-4-carboxy-5-ureidoimidazoline decarboxylase